MKKPKAQTRKGAMKARNLYVKEHQVENLGAAYIAYGKRLLKRVYMARHRNGTGVVEFCEDGSIYMNRRQTGEWR